MHGCMIRELEFQVLCQRHGNDIFRYAYSLLGNSADAEDATQEVLLRLWNHLPRINLFKVRAWLVRTTRNYCLDQIRRRSHPAEGAALDDEVAEDRPDDLAVDPSSAADSHLRLEQAHGALLKLPEILRSVFVLYEVNGLRYREIAVALGIPINTVKVNLLRARKRLSKLVLGKESCTTPCKS
jgi:RNA polymerase sigma-70 factor (ECF subfamily)